MSSIRKSSVSCSSEDDADQQQLRRGPWTLDEDSLLIHYIARHGEGRWNLLAKRAVAQSLDQVASAQHQALMTLQQQVAGQGPGSEAVQNLENQEQNSSDSEHCASSCVSSSESMNKYNNISQISQFADYQSSPFQIVGNSEYNVTDAKDCYYVNDDNNNSNTGCYDMETINQLASTSALGDFAKAVGDCHMAENNWVGDGFADGLWNMGELWDLRNLQ
ncbi:hypothetical protein COLO4_04897 [Corchorus olitorius]|uniref:Uncharacterized protein n=1 Tax=Corchorus olitorius TaxID=93759 RepID=A0A1R3KSF7_9ROSI|nr:hypothetical protein COLO4_04897 [Corchorus olitorius]